MTVEERYPDQMSPRNAAIELGMSLQDFYYGMDKGYLNVGWVRKEEGKCKRHFVVFRAWVAKDKERLKNGGLAEAIRQAREKRKEANIETETINSIVGDFHGLNSAGEGRDHKGAGGQLSGA